MHDESIPFSGPPSYVTLARRFSSLYPSPVKYYAEKKEKEAIERREFVDIHDISGPDPNDYDVLVSDVTHDILSAEISQVVGIPYLKQATQEEANEVLDVTSGFIYGQKKRIMLPSVISVNGKGKAHWVFFLYDTGSPLTYISPMVAEALGCKTWDEQPYIAKICGRQQPIYRSPGDSHFKDINLLGMDYIKRYRVRPWVHDEDDGVTFLLGNKWKIPKL